MREIKFRAWDESNKIMHYDFQFISSGENGNDWIVFKSDKQPLNEANVFDNPYFRQQFHIEQYTGLNDKNSKEDYEGNLLKDLYTGLVCVVKYGSFTSQNGSGTGFYLEKLDGKVYIPYPCNLDCWIIIGNIHEATTNG